MSRHMSLEGRRIIDDGLNLLEPLTRIFFNVPVFSPSSFAVSTRIGAVPRLHAAPC